MQAKENSSEKREMCIKNKKKSNTKGITLVALVVTIVILLILAGITITYVFGDNGIIKLAQDAKKQTDEAMKKEQEDVGNLVNWLREEYEETMKPEKEVPIDTDTSYVGYYADMDGNGSVDGIIYADLAKGKTATGDWGDSNGAYEIEAVTTGLKKYTISNKTYVGQTVAGIYKANDGFGEKQVITPVEGSSGIERFYIMALEDVQLAHSCSELANSAYWYYNACGLMTDYDSYTSKSFGSGKINTKKMIARWNKTNTTEVPNATEVDYGEKNEKDLWGQIETRVSNGWYVPSKEEWSAFAGELGIKGLFSSGFLVYSDCGLSDVYWSSSQLDDLDAWSVNIKNGYMSYDVVKLAGVTGTYRVRLGASF